MKDVFFGKFAREKMLNGVDIVGNAVGGTLGPKGLNVFIQKDLQSIVTNDGATISANIKLSDPLEDLGAESIRNPSNQTNDDAGDGTSTTVVVAQSLIHEALKRPENAMEVRESLKEASEKVLKLLTKRSTKIAKEDIEKVALISAEDKHLAKIISDIIIRLGEKAVINVEDSKTFATDYEIVDGYEATTGFISPHFINDKKTGKAIYENVPVLVTRKKISNIQDIAPLFDQFAKQKINTCVIVCEEIDDSMIGVFVANKNMGLFNSLVIRSSGPVTEDIAGCTGARIVSDESGVNFQNITVDDLGRASKVVCDAHKTLFLGDGDASKTHATILEKRAENEPNMYLQKNLKQRVARLRGGIAILRIAAASDFEREYLKLKAEDAIKATQAALEEGIVEGGGMALWRIAQELQGKTIGEEILKKSLTAPLKRIIENAGKDYAEIIKDLPDGCGYDAKNDLYVDMIKAGICDPHKVERCALQNAISASTTFITTFATITNHKDEK